VLGWCFPLGRTKAFRSAGHHGFDERGIRELDQLYDFSILKFQQVEALGR
jgi:hypothetical protein